MHLPFLSEQRRAEALRTELLMVGSEALALHLVRHPKARRYILRLRRDGSLRVTLPRNGSVTYALEFARRSSPWIEKQLARHKLDVDRTGTWTDGSQVLFLGERVTLRSRLEHDILCVQLADHVVLMPASTTDLRPNVESYLWALAAKELIPRTLQLAAHHQVIVRRVVVRSQRTRWGSCSPRGTISLNWRLIQAPPFVRDYLIIHELQHLREMNHSARFWRLVEAACPEYAQAEAWLDAHSSLLR